MSYSVCVYLTEADKVKSVYGACDNLLLNQLKAALKPGLDSLNDYFCDSLNTDMDAYALLYARWLIRWCLWCPVADGRLDG